MNEPIIFENAVGARMTFYNQRILNMAVLTELNKQGYKLISGNL